MEAIFTDGGTFGRNPSPYGGAWAWIRMDTLFGAEIPLGNRVGVLFPKDTDNKYVTNNQTEFYAMLDAIESLPRGWEGQVCSDSLITLGRFFVLGEVKYRNKVNQLYPHKNIPESWVRRRDISLSRLGWKVEPILLSGHPTIRELQVGVGKRGTPVSIYNKWCDDQCRKITEEWRKVHEYPTSSREHANL